MASDPQTPSTPPASTADSDSDNCPPPQPPPPPPHDQPPPSPPPSPPPHPFSHTAPSLLERALRKRRTWVALFLLAYAALISSSWNLLLSIRAWYASATSDPSAASGAGWWLAAAYASAMYGLVFGVLSMAAALAVALPATLVTWITLLVLLAFAGKPRRRLVDDGRKITADIAGVVIKVVVTEGRAVAVACAVLCFFALRRKRREEEGGD